MPPFAAGLQELLSEGSFVDVRISCSDHSTSDGLGSHKVVLAGASPSLLMSCLDTGEEEDMVCILLPDFPSSLVASVLSILYYGEVWLSHLSHQVETVNSLFCALGLDIFIIGHGQNLKLVRKSEMSSSTQAEQESPPKRIKTEDSFVHIKNIKKEERTQVCGRSLVPTVQTATVHTSTVKPASLLKCPSCQFYAGTIPEMQKHIYECKHTVSDTANDDDLKPLNLTIKREQLSQVKLETIDPLEKRDDANKKEEDQKNTSTKSTTKSIFKNALNLKLDKVKFERQDEEEEEEVAPGEGELTEMAQDQMEEEVDDPSSEETGSETGGEETQVQCVKCPFASTSISALQAHVSMHQRKEFLRETKTVCPVCNLRTSSIPQLKDHLVKSYSVQSSNSLKCSLNNCDKIIDANKASQPQLFYHHILYDHYGSKYKLRCEFCSFRSVTTSKLKEHLMQHMDERPFKCRLCSNNGFRTKRHLKEHKLSVHGPIKPVKCTDCSLTFSSMQLYKRHRKLKHSTQTFQCDVCEKQLCNLNALKCHRKNVHRAYEPTVFVCEQCGRDANRCGCDTEVTKEKTVFCPECGKEMLSKNLSSHLHYHRQSALRPFICQECSKTFTHAASLKRHALIHTGHKKYKCKECGKQFHQKTALETHLKTHSSERLSCKGCSKRFLTRYLLNFHLKSRRLCYAAYNL